MPKVLLYAYGPALLVLHALVALALCGAGVHQAVVALHALRGRPRPRLSRVYGIVVLCTYLGALLTGGLLYPRYRYFVRALYLDRHAPWAANLFDFKENLATLALPLAVGTLLLCPAASAADEAPGALRQQRQLYAGFAVALMLVSLWMAVSGLLCTGVRGL